MNAKTVKPMQVITDTDKLNALFKSIKGRGKALQKDMHLAACSVLAHMVMHKDIRIIDGLINAMPDISRKNALHAWMEHFGPVDYIKGKFVYNQAKYDLMTKDLLMSAEAKPFWTFNANEGEAYKPLNVTQEVGRLVARLNKDMEKAGANHLQLVNILNAYLAAENIPEQSDVPMIAKAA